VLLTDWPLMTVTDRYWELLAATGSR